MGTSVLLAGAARDGDTLVLSGMNVQVVNGTGDTHVANRLGNLIVGVDHTYSSYAGLLAGLNNTTSGRFASVTGDGGNVASGLRASVTGGRGNQAADWYTTVAGGRDGTIPDDGSLDASGNDYDSVIGNEPYPDD